MGGKELRRDDREGIKTAKDEVQRYEAGERGREREISDNVIGELIEGVIFPWKGFSGT